MVEAAEVWETGMAGNLAKACAANMEAAGNRRGWQQTWPGHSQCRTPAVIPPAAQPRLRLGRGRRISQVSSIVEMHGPSLTVGVSSVENYLVQTQAPPGEPRSW